LDVINRLTALVNIYNDTEINLGNILHCNLSIAVIYTYTHIHIKTQNIDI